MVDENVREDIRSLLEALRSTPKRLPLAEVAAVHRSGFDVSIERDGGETVVQVMPRQDDRLSALTRREREVATLVAGGYSNQQIGTALFISVATVKDHLHAIFTKTGFRSRAQLIAAWYGGAMSEEVVG